MPASRAPRRLCARSAEAAPRSRSTPRRWSGARRETGSGMLAHRAGGDRAIAGAIVPNATDAPPRSSPQPLPPLRRRDLTRVHARFHLIGIPAREPDERLRFALLTGGNLVEVALRLGAG